LFLLSAAGLIDLANVRMYGESGGRKGNEIVPALLHCNFYVRKFLSYLSYMSQVLLLGNYNQYVQNVLPRERRFTYSFKGDEEFKVLCETGLL
jgi:hypothetical protein